MNAFWTTLPRRSLGFRAALLGLWLAAVAVVLFPLAALIGGGRALAAAGAAAAICSAAAAIALVVSHLLQGAGLVLAALLMGMAVRTGLPLIPAVALQFRGGPLVDAGFLYYLLVFYLLSLTGETSSRCRLVDRPASLGNPSLRSYPAMDLEELARHIADTTEFHLPGMTIHLPRVFGFQLTRFMVLELVAAAADDPDLHSAGPADSHGRPPKGLFWNLFEVMLVFIRDEVARPAIGKHDADRFLPFLWNMFFFILFCNLLGILPWAGSPTGALTVTAALAGLTFLRRGRHGHAEFGAGGLS